MVGNDTPALANNSGFAPFTVSFNANNGSGTIASIGGQMGASVTLPVSGFSRGGKTLAGWNTQADGGGTAHALGARYTINGSAILYAVWTWANTGVPGDPYLIYDAAGLAEINNNNTAHYKLENDITLEGTWYSLNTGSGFLFDGGGHTVHFDSVTITGPMDLLTDEPGWGLFGTVAYSIEIKNLRVTGSISAERNDGGSHFYLGGIVGFISNATVRNCVSTVDVTATGGYAGGIVGGMYSGCSIIACYATGPVSMSPGGQNFVYGSMGAGGIVGLGRNNVTACYAENTVSASGGTPTISAIAGGIWAYTFGGAPTNSVALNPSLSVTGTGTLTTHRIGGTNVSNYGRDDMSMYQNGSPYGWTPGGNNGTNVTAPDFTTEAWWSALFGSYWAVGPANESQPWKWNPVLQRPVLWFE
jgi:hypothetical protein